MIDTLIQNNAANPSSGVDVLIDAAPAITKLLSSTWAPGSNVGGLDQGAIVPGATIHGFLIQNGSTYEAVFSASSIAPLIPTGWTQVEPIGAVLLDSVGSILPFIQEAREDFRLKTPIEVNFGANTATPTLRNLPVPLGLKVEVKMFAEAQNTGGNGSDVCIFDADLGPQPINAFNAVFIRLPGQPAASGDISCFTNAAGQIYTGDDGAGSNTLVVFVQGWRYPRDAI